MYGKIFQTIFTGSLYGRFEATVTHIACIVLSDREGHLNYTPSALAGATGFPLEVIQKGLAELMADDPASRSKDHDGRRVIEVEPGSMNGFFVVNKAQYRDMQDPDSIREQTRERVRNYRKRTVTAGNASLRHTDTDANTDSDKRHKTAPAGAGFDGFWTAYPRKVGKKDALKVWNRVGLDPIADSLIEDVNYRKLNDDAWKDKRFIPHPSTYLNQERWNDEVQKYEAPKRNLSAVDRVREATDRREAERQRRAREGDGHTVETPLIDLRPQVVKPVR